MTAENGLVHPKVPCQSQHEILVVPPDAVGVDADVAHRYCRVAVTEHLADMFDTDTGPVHRVPARLAHRMGAETDPWPYLVADGGEHVGDGPPGDRSRLESARAPRTLKQPDVRRMPLKPSRDDVEGAAVERDAPGLAGLRLDDLKDGVIRVEFTNVVNLECQEIGDPQRGVQAELPGIEVERPTLGKSGLDLLALTVRFDRVDHLHGALPVCSLYLHRRNSLADFRCQRTLEP